MAAVLIVSAAARERAVPGVTEMLALASAAEIEAERYGVQFAAMMADGDNDGARPPKPENRAAAERLAELMSVNSRAALYLRAKAQADRAHWSDGTGAGAAGRRAMEMLIAGSSEAEAEAALAVRREWVD